MAGPGRAPKQVLSRPRDTARRQAEMTKVAPDGVLRGPDLPDYDWHPRTLTWWETWRRSPLAQEFGQTDWDFLIDTAFLHSQMWNGEIRLASEVRLRAAKFGATPEDRLRLKVEVDQEAEQVKKAPASKARKARLLNVVNAS
jgi:hypothetical protein